MRYLRPIPGRYSSYRTVNVGVSTHFKCSSLLRGSRRIFGIKISGLRISSNFQAKSNFSSELKKTKFPTRLFCSQGKAKGSCLPRRQLWRFFKCEASTLGFPNSGHQLWVFLILGINFGFS